MFDGSVFDSFPSPRKGPTKAIPLFQRKQILKGLSMISQYFKKHLFLSTQNNILVKVLNTLYSLPFLQHGLLFTIHWKGLIPEKVLAFRVCKQFHLNSCIPLYWRGKHTKMTGLSKIYTCLHCKNSRCSKQVPKQKCLNHADARLSATATLNVFGFFQLLELHILLSLKISSFLLNERHLFRKKKITVQIQFSVQKLILIYFLQ